MKKDQKPAEIVDISLHRMKAGSALKERRKKRFLLILALAALPLAALLEALLQDESNLKERAQVPVSFTSEDGRNGIRLEADELGHYYVLGEVNGHEVVFMVDTGASVVHLPERVAMQIPLRAHGKGYSLTANGRIEVSKTRLDEVTLGSLSVEGINGSFARGMEDGAALLGMSFLRQFEMRQTNDMLELLERQ